MCSVQHAPTVESCNRWPAPQPLLAVVKLPPALRGFAVKLPPPPVKLPALLEAREVGRLSSPLTSFSTLSTVLRLMKRCTFTCERGQMTCNGAAAGRADVRRNRGRSIALAADDALHIYERADDV